MRFLRTTLFALSACAFLAACAAPPPTTGPVSTMSTYVPPPDGAPSYGPGDTCADTYVIVSASARTNFSLGSENYKNQDYCGAYPYLKWLIANDPLFTGEDPDDRTFLRMASVYEWFATKVDSTNQSELRAYLDSSLATRAAGRRAMDDAGVEYDAYLRDLREGFFYFQNAPVYTDADAKQFSAFDRAFTAKPDSLEDWYIGQLFSGTATKFSDNLQARSDYIKRLAEYVDSPGNKTYYGAIAEALIAVPAEPVISSDTVVEDLVAKIKDGSATLDQKKQILALTISDPERLSALGEDPGALQSSLLRDREILAEVDNPRTLIALAFQSYRDGNSARGNELFNRAIANAANNGARADYFYSRCARGFGNCSSDIAQALQYNPGHGPSLYRRAGLMAAAVGRPSTTAGRAAYWCLADQYRNVAASTNDSRIASQARRAAAQYDRAGPSREQYFLDPGWRPGQSVTASLGSFGSCTTRVR